MKPHRAAYVLAEWVAQSYTEESLPGPVWRAVQVIHEEHVKNPPILEQAPVVTLELDAPSAKLLCACYGLAIAVVDDRDDEMVNTMAKLTYIDIKSTPDSARLALVKAMSQFQRDTANASHPGLGDAIGIIQEALFQHAEGKKGQ